MRVILVYDIETVDREGQNRLNRARKVARKYLHHVQKSVFEGSISVSNLQRLKNEMLRVIDKEKDSVIIYIFEEGLNYEREILSNGADPTDTFL
ncbi:CRISPR-associated endonuclease Cas2 [Thermocrinis sp.]